VDLGSDRGSGARVGDVEAFATRGSRCSTTDRHEDGSEPSGFVSLSAPARRLFATVYDALSVEKHRALVG